MVTAEPRAPGKPGPIETFERTEQGTVINRELPDGARQTIILAPDGAVTRTTERVNPSTGATVTLREAPDGISETTTLPNGSSTKLTTFPDGGKQRDVVEFDDKGFPTRTTTFPNGGVETERQSRDPDGTDITFKRLPDGTEEVRTRHVVTDDKGSVTTRTTGPEGDKVVQENLDGTSHTVLTLPDGTAETKDVSELPGGGGFRFKVTHPDGSVDVEVTRTINHPDGSVSAQTVRKDGIDTETRSPTGDKSTINQFHDGTSEGSSTVKKPDGTLVHEEFQRDGSKTTVEHRNPVGNEPPKTITTKSDGTQVEQFVDPAPPGTMQTITFRPDGSKELTNLDLDGRGTTTEFGPDGALKSTKQHVPVTDVDPNPPVGDSAPSTSAAVAEAAPADGAAAPPDGQQAEATEPAAAATARDAFEESTTAPNAAAPDATAATATTAADATAAPRAAATPEADPVTGVAVGTETVVEQSTAADAPAGDSIGVAAAAGAGAEQPTGDVQIDVVGDSRPTEEVERHEAAETVNVGMEEREPISKDPDDPDSLIVGGGPLEQPPDNVEYVTYAEPQPSEGVDVPADRELQRHGDRTHRARPFGAGSRHGRGDHPGVVVGVPSTSLEPLTAERREEP